MSWPVRAFGGSQLEAVGGWRLATSASPSAREATWHRTCWCRPFKTRLDGLKSGHGSMVWILLVACVSALTD